VHELALNPVGGLLGLGSGRNGRFEIFGQIALGRQHLGVVFGQPQGRHEPGPTGGRQFRQLVLPAGDIGRVQTQGDQIGIGKIAVVVGLFLAAHGRGDVFGHVVKPRLLDDGQAVVEQIALALHLVFDGLLHVAEAVEIFKLRAGAEGRLADRTQAHVGVAAKRTFLHVAVADTEIDEDGAQSLQIGHGLLRTAHVRLGDDLYKRHAGPVEIHEACVLGGGMDVFPGILFHVDTGDADALLLAVHGDVHMAVLADGLLELGNLIALGQIRVEVVLTGKDRHRVDGAVGGQAHLGGELHDLGVQDRQHARHPRTDRTDVGVGIVAEMGGTAAEDLALGFQLGVHFETDDRLVPGHVSLLGHGRAEARREK